MTGYYTADDCHADDFAALIAERIDPATLQFTNSVQSNVPIYTAADLDSSLSTLQDRRALMAEWASVLNDHGGVVLLKGVIPDLSVAEPLFTSSLSIIFTTPAIASDPY